MNSNEDNSNVTSSFSQGTNNNVDKLSTINANISSLSSAATNSEILATNSTKCNTNVAEPIKDLEEQELRKLLEEAYSYKSPKDRENKSEIFRQMLQNVEEKDRIPSKHGGSLQDLVEAQAAHNDVLSDYEYIYNNRNRRHHNSRPKKYCSLVSSRQREGGSLPSNVNVSNCNLSIHEPSFLNEIFNKRRGIGVNKSERTVSGTSCNSATSGTSSTTGHDSLNSTSGKDIELTNCVGITSGGDTIIDIGENYSDDSHILTYESIQKGYPNTMDEEGFHNVMQLSNKKYVTRSSSIYIGNQGKLEHTIPEPRHYVDDAITFTSLERGKACVDNLYVSLNENYQSCKSVMGEKPELAKQSFTTPTKIISKQCDENGNSLNSPYNNSASQSQAKAKKKKSQSDRNTKIYNVTTLAGYRGNDPVEVLVKYIENTNDDKKNVKKLNESKRKDKKKDKENNKKLKKSNSLEELRSSTKMDEDEKQEIVGNVRMRNKNANKQNNKSSSGISSTACSSTSSNSSTQDNPNEIKENLKQNHQINHKRGERRSWGTEELTYLGENNAIEEVREKVKDKEKKKVKDIQNNSGTTINSSQFDESFLMQDTNKMETFKAKKKLDPISLSHMSIDSLPCESAEFHVVTKKKKSKKRQNNSDISNDYNNRSGGLLIGVHNNNNNNNNSNKLHRDSIGHNKKYPISSNFANDRDLYLHSFNTNKDKKSRRKSTSSMPPSEKSDSSDLESVHSLPIESTSSSSNNRSNNNQSSQATKSYADMARTNAATTSAMNEKWPTVTGSNEVNNNGNQSNNGNGNNGNIKNVYNKKSSVTNKDFPELHDKINNNDINNVTTGSTNSKQILYSQSLTTTEEKNLSSHQQQSNILSDKSIAIDKSSIGSGAKSPILSRKPSNVTVSSMTEKLIDSPVIFSSSSSGSKQTLQKSKSVESDGYYNSMDQYPALEATVKKHITTSVPTATTMPQPMNIVHIKNSQTGTPMVIPIIPQRQIQNQPIVVSIKPQFTGSSVFFNLPNTNLPLTISSQQQQQQQQQTQQSLNQTTETNFSHITDESSQLAKSNSIKELNPINTNSVIFTTNAFSTSSSSNNLSSNNNNTTTTININDNDNNNNNNNRNNSNNDNTGKKSSIKQQNNFNQMNNAKVNETQQFIASNIESSSSSSSSPLQSEQNLPHDLLSMKKLGKNVSTITNIITDNSTTTISSSSSSLLGNSNGRKNKKVDKYQQPQQNHYTSRNMNNQENSLPTTTTTTTAAINRNHNSSNNLNNAKTTTTTATTTNTNRNPNSSRPAVIILNDDSSGLSIASEFTFGDFKEEELQFYNNSGNKNLNSNPSDKENCDSNIVGNVLDAINSSNNNGSNANIYGNSANLSHISSGDNNLDDSGAQFSFGSIGNIESAINCSGIVMNSTDITSDNDKQQQQQQHLQSPTSDYGYSSLSVINRSIISDDNSIDISNKLSSTAHDIEQNLIQDSCSNIMADPNLHQFDNSTINTSNKMQTIHNLDQNDDVNKTNKKITNLKQSLTSNVDVDSAENSSINNSTNNNNLLSNLSSLDSNLKMLSLNDVATNTTLNNATSVTINAAHSATIPNNNKNSKINYVENQKKSKKEVNIRYVAPQQEINTMNFDKIVNFVGLAWEEIAHGNQGTHFYNGQ